MSIHGTELQITLDGRPVRTLEAEQVQVPPGRGAPIGMTADGTLYAALAIEGPGLESVLLSSTDQGRSWAQQPLDWRQFADHTLAPDAPRAEFFKNRWAMRNDSFGVLRDGTLLWAFNQVLTPYGFAGPGGDLFVIRSEDRGRSWDGPVKIDKQGFGSAGNNSNRMTELPDGTVLWPVRLGMTASQMAEIPPYTVKDLLTVNGNYVVRSSDQGRNWVDPAPMPDGSDEATLLRLQSGRIIAAIRFQLLIDVESPWSKYSKSIFLADSQDDGRTWVDFRPVRRTRDGPVDVKVGECHGELNELSDGTLVLTHDRRYPTDQQRVVARISRDRGQTWLPEHYHLTRAWKHVPATSPRGYGTGYASSVVLDDDTIVTMTGAGHALRWRVQPA